MLLLPSFILTFYLLIEKYKEKHLCQTCSKCWRHSLCPHGAHGLVGGTGENNIIFFFVTIILLQVYVMYMYKYVYNYMRL